MRHEADAIDRARMSLMDQALYPFEDCFTIVHKKAFAKKLGRVVGLH
jgi:hypothetical protein